MPGRAPAPHRVRREIEGPPSGTLEGMDPSTFRRGVHEAAALCIRPTPGTRVSARCAAASFPAQPARADQRDELTSDVRLSQQGTWGRDAPESPLGRRRSAAHRDRRRQRVARRGPGGAWWMRSSGPHARRPHGTAIRRHSPSDAWGGIKRHSSEAWVAIRRHSSGCLDRHPAPIRRSMCRTPKPSGGGRVGRNSPRTPVGSRRDGNARERTGARVLASRAIGSS